MPPENSLSRKEKKAQRDAERLEKGKKRKLSKRSQAEGAQQNESTNPEPVAENDALHEKSPPKAQSLKRKADEVEGQSAPNEDGSQKRKKAKKSSTTKPEGENEPASSTKPRFILFVGNLPYTTTDASLKAHFQKLAPFSLRHRTDPKTKKSKGFAFLEFEHYDRMKTCLKLYHHSMFAPDGKENGEGNEKKNNARKINVELTAGGGGKAEGRRDKIKAKNVKLEEQRKRRAKVEREEKAKKEKTDIKPSKEKAVAPVESDGPVVVDNTGIHPSRLARIKH